MSPHTRRPRKATERTPFDPPPLFFARFPTHHGTKPGANRCHTTGATFRLLEPSQMSPSSTVTVTKGSSVFILPSTRSSFLDNPIMLQALARWRTPWTVGLLIWHWCSGDIDSDAVFFFFFFPEPGFKTPKGKGFNIAYAPRTPSTSSVNVPVTLPPTPVSPTHTHSTPSISAPVTLPATPDSPIESISVGTTLTPLKRKADDPAQDQPMHKQYRLLADPNRPPASAGKTTRRSTAAAVASGSGQTHNIWYLSYCYCWVCRIKFLFDSVVQI